MFPLVTFNQPLAARAALIILAFLVLWLLIKRNQRRLLHRFGLFETLQGFSQIRTFPWGAILLAVSAALALLAAAEPALKNGTDRTGRTLNAVVVLDVSRSMLAEDTPSGVSRSDLARAALGELFDAYPQGYFGLVTVARNPRSYVPTNDHAALRMLVAYNGDPYRARDEGSNLPGALQEAADLIKDSEIPVDVVVLLTDGGSMGIDPRLYQLALNDFTEMGVRVVSAGVGGLELVPIPVRNPDGSLRGYHSQNGILAVTSRNDGALRFVAEGSGGVYLVIQDARDLVEAVRGNNLAAQPVRQAGEVSLAYIPLLASLLFLLLFLLDSGWPLRRSRFFGRFNKG